MENLNAETVKKALECCSADTTDCHSCPYSEFSEFNCFDNAKKDALALINSQEQRIEAYRQELGEVRIALAEANKERQELTEENERLREQAYRLECDLQLNADEKAVAKAIEQTKKATVRKMQERLDKHFCHDPAFLGVEQRLIMGAVDQIAKEMLEGGVT